MSDSHSDSDESVTSTAANSEIENAHITIQSSQKHKKKLIINGNGFIKKKVNKDNSTHWCCDQKHVTNCAATAKTNEADGLMTLNDNHNHDLRIIENARAAGRNDMKQNAVNNYSAPPSVIAQSAQFACQSLGHRFGSSKNLKAIVNYSRKKESDNSNNTPTPKDINFKFSPNHGNLNGKSIILDDWCGVDSKGEKGRVIIFGTIELLKQMFAASFWAIDGTFKTRPFMFSQILTIFASGIAGDIYTCYPMAWILMTRRTQAQYQQVMKMLYKSAMQNNFPINVEYVQTDFEIGISSAVLIEIKSTATPPVEILTKFCNFHFFKLLNERMKSFGLGKWLYGSVDNYDMFNQLKALSYLPTELINEAFEDLHNRADDSFKIMTQWFKVVSFDFSCCWI